MNDEGIMYSLFGPGKKLWDEFDVSLYSLKKTNPGVKVCLVTNNADIPKKFLGRIDTVVQVTEKLHFFKLKVIAFLHSPFKRTVFLDLDTKVKDDIAELFEFLRYYDMAVAPDPLCDWEKDDYFIDYFNLQNLNTGVLAFQKNKTTESFFNYWLQSFIDQDDSFFLNVPGKSDDQDFFNKAVVEETQTKKFGLKLMILPNTVYNARPWIWRNMKKENIAQRTKIVHAHKLSKTRFTEIQKKLGQKFKEITKIEHN